MRVAAIYDIHGNLPALEAVLGEIARTGVDRIVVGGDIVPGPMPRQSIEALLQLPVPVHFIPGNGENDILAALQGGVPERVPERWHPMMRWVARQLPPEHTARFASWPATVRLEIPELGRVLFCHATPRSDNEIFTRLTPAERLAPIFEAAGAEIVICGHTHMPFCRRIGTVQVVNAGSVGMPFGRPGADWLLLGPGIEVRHTAYDLKEAAARIGATGYPDAGDFSVLHPRSEVEMLELFESAALGAAK